MSREDVLVTTQWAEENLDTPGVVFAEVDEDTTAYDAGHIRGAVKFDWRKDLQDGVRREFVERYFNDLEPRVNATLAAMDRLGQVLTRVMQECSDREA